MRRLAACLESVACVGHPRLLLMLLKEVVLVLSQNWNFWTKQLATKRSTDSWRWESWKRQVWMTWNKEQFKSTRSVMDWRFCDQKWQRRCRFVAREFQGADHIWHWSPTSFSGALLLWMILSFLTSRRKSPHGGGMKKLLNRAVPAKVLARTTECSSSVFRLPM